MTMKEGVYDGIPNHKYHGGEGVSKSGLDLLAVSPLHYRAALEAANDNEPTPAQALGSAFHALLLEPEEFAQQYVPEFVAPEGALVTVDDIKGVLKDLGEKVTGNKPELIERLKAVAPDAVILEELKHDYAVRNAGRTILKADIWAQLGRMHAAVMAHPAARALLSMPGKAEQSVYWVDKATGELCRCRPDYWAEPDRANIVVDVKTTDDASPEGFAHSIHKWRYHVQDAFYTDGIQQVTGKAPTFVFLAVEKSARVVDGEALGVGVYMLDADSKTLGRATYREELDTYAMCRKSGKWPGYGNRIQPIALPVWFIQRNSDKLAS